MRFCGSIFRPIWLKRERAKFQVISAFWGENGCSSLFTVWEKFLELLLVTSKGPYQRWGEEGRRVDIQGSFPTPPAQPPEHAESKAGWQPPNPTPLRCNCAKWVGRKRKCKPGRVWSIPDWSWMEPSSQSKTQHGLGQAARLGLLTR